MKINKTNILYLAGLLLAPQILFAEQMGNHTGDHMQQQQMQHDNSAANSSETNPAEETGATSSTSAPMPEPKNDATEEMTGFSRGTVARSVFTTQIDNREPVDKVKKVPGQDGIFYFTELRDMAGQTAKHRWEFKGKVIAEVDFNVRGPRWRVWSKKTFQPGWSGDWKVSVVNGAGEVISEDVIAYSQDQLNQAGGESNHMNNAAGANSAGGNAAMGDNAAGEHQTKDANTENKAPSGMQAE